MINPTSYQVLGVKCECIKIILYRYFALWQMLGMYFRAQKKQNFLLDLKKIILTKVAVQRKM